ncbi:energy transducer TonB [Rhodoferax sp. GW822-FHT02A01]|uniref:energy transducer TonB n=1 Tax=Rhodoferax sp. GW822-FHT02A01 TaxID=3141537 RepID=UPI00315D15D6
MKVYRRFAAIPDIHAKISYLQLARQAEWSDGFLNFLQVNPVRLLIQRMKIQSQSCPPPNNSAERDRLQAVLVDSLRGSSRQTLAFMKIVIASFITVALACGCASDSSRYQIGRTGALQNKSDAELHHAEIIDSEQPFASEGFDVPPKLLESHLPGYPISQRDLKTDASVRIRFIIDVNGSICDPIVLGAPPPELAAVVLDSVMRWKFSPALKNGIPVRVRTQQVFTFRPK